MPLRRPGTSLSGSDVLSIVSDETAASNLPTT